MIRNVLKRTHVFYRYDDETLAEVFTKVLEDFPNHYITSEESGLDSVGKYLKFVINPKELK